MYTLRCISNHPLCCCLPVITSSSTREYVVSLKDGTTQNKKYQWRETITYQSCAHDESARKVPSTQMLRVEHVLVMYDTTHQLMRYAMSNKIGDMSGGEHRKSFLPFLCTSRKKRYMMYVSMVWILKMSGTKIMHGHHGNACKTVEFMGVTLDIVELGLFWPVIVPSVQCHVVLWEGIYNMVWRGCSYFICY